VKASSGARRDGSVSVRSGTARSVVSRRGAEWKADGSSLIEKEVVIGAYCHFYRPIVRDEGAGAAGRWRCNCSDMQVSFLGIAAETRGRYSRSPPGRLLIYPRMCFPRSC
jgi:hypothetical protein